ncbi:MAG: DUF883 C-terminal domain-containing protein [Porticoccaceae bacterium]|jgi:ElaB/YqjD/DUF883 family membrane-anchored ribosome-binding protein
MATTNNKSPTRDEEVEAGKEAVLAAYSNLLEATEHFKHAARVAGLDLKTEAAEQLLKGREKASAVGHQASEYVHEKPLVSLSIAFFAGFLIAQLLGRR